MLLQFWYQTWWLRSMMIDDNDNRWLWRGRNDDHGEGGDENDVDGIIWLKNWYNVASFWCAEVTCDYTEWTRDLLWKIACEGNCQTTWENSSTAAAIAWQ